MEHDITVLAGRLFISIRGGLVDMRTALEKLLEINVTPAEHPFALCTYFLPALATISSARTVRTSCGCCGPLVDGGPEARKMAVTCIGCGRDSSA